MLKENDPPQPVAPTQRDRQREALDGLIRLVKDCAAGEVKITADYAAAQQRADKSFSQARDATETKYKSLLQAVEEKCSHRTVEADKNFEWAKEELSGKSKARRQRLVHEHDKLVEDIKQKMEHAAWLADSVLEAAEIRIKEEHKKAVEQVEAAAKSLEAVENRATGTMINLNQPRPSESAAVPEAPAEAPVDPNAEFEKNIQLAEQKLAELEGLTIPRLVGGTLNVLGGIFCVAAIGVPQAIAYYQQQPVPNWAMLAVTAFLSIGATIAVVLVLGIQAKKQVAAAYVPLRQALDAAGLSIKRMSEQAEQRRQDEEQAAIQTRKKEIHSAKETLSPMVDDSAKGRDVQVQAVRGEAAKRLADLEKQRNAARAEAQAWRKELAPKVQKRAAREAAAVQDRHDAAQFNAQVEHDKARADLERQWGDGLALVRAPMEESATAITDWSLDHWAKWTPPKKFAETIRFGEFQVDLKTIVEMVAPGTGFTLPLPEAFALPALLAFPRQSSLLIHSDPAGRQQALSTLRLVMTRLLTCLPAGRVRFTIIDPVGMGQNFSGFMHLTDFDEALVGTRIWTRHEDIDQRLTDLTEHMETVIQKYLRNEYETIDEYNAQAGELAEPYRFLVIADFPEQFEADAQRRLASIASTGARCGVYIIMARDTRFQIPSGAHFNDVEAKSVNLVRKEEKFHWKDEIFKQFPLTLDAPPPEESLTKILQVVGEGAKQASRVEVPFENITPKPNQLWTLNSAGDLGVPVGRMGATRLQYVRLGRGMAQHALVAGKTGSGKSSLLNALITNLALWYPPDQVMLYLIDFKKGVEFKTYATHNLPHAKAIAVESDREFGLSVLQRIDAELTQRGETYRKLGVQDLAAYRQTPDAKAMPRIMLIIDEFQEFFSEDDKLAQEANQLLDRLVRQGRAFGIHVFLGSQTLAGSSGLSRSTIGQMGVRIALQCSEADSQLILGDNNSAARLLSRPGEAIYNDAGGLVENNSPFQVAWLPDDKREEMLKAVQAKAANALGEWESPIIFEGNAPAPIVKNVQLGKLLDQPAWPPPPGVPVAWLGDPVAIKPPTAVGFRRQSGANLMMIGQQEEGAMAMLASVIYSISAQYAPGGVKFVVFDGSAVDSPLAKVLPAVKESLPHEIELVDFRAAPDAINLLAEEMAKRQAAEPTAAHSGGTEIFLLIYGMQRYRILRKEEESFSSFSATDEVKKPQPGKQFADLLREGPGLGMHVVAWVDTPANIDRTLERAAMREFDYRVLFQMSANDSSNLIDSPAANKLGSNRVLVYSEEQGTMEKFRPYALPDKEWLERVKKAAGAKKPIPD
jgi:DNA segregation ATPase FtsK/SpoIIIE, S-DNA-T family